jgi:hypothetical protein
MLQGRAPVSQQDDQTTSDDDRVLRFADWCRLNSFSIATGRRIIQGGKGPPIDRKIREQLLRDWWWRR